MPESNTALGIIGLTSMVGWIAALALTIWTRASNSTQAMRWRKPSLAGMVVLLTVFMVAISMVENSKPHPQSTNTSQEVTP
jgi:hypothetical protein